MRNRHADEPTADVAFDVLAEPLRRDLLTVLGDSHEPSSSAPGVPIDVLATDVSARASDCPVVSDDRTARIRVSLAHVHLPRLEDAGLVRRDEEGTVSLTDHPLLEREWVRRLLDDPTGGSIGDEEALNRTLEAFGSAHRRAVCEALAHQRGDVPVAELATLVAARLDESRRLVDVDEPERARVETELIHRHLPALAAAGVVSYDRSAGTVAIAADAPQWRADWLVESPLGDVADRLGTSTLRSRTDSGAGCVAGESSAAGTCWTIEGAENVVVRAREIADSAEDELFVTAPDRETFDRRSLERWAVAADRGVDVYVGSGSPHVRDTVRSVVPEATICEPQFDWINFPVDRLQHGRVVFADRERVMLVTSKEEPSGDEPTVTAITGEGASNTLVSLVREHVGPRLDRLETNADAGDAHEWTPLPM